MRRWTPPPTDPYRVLELRPGATAHEIRAAYRQRAKRVHPDVSGADPIAATEFRDIQEAYRLLSDPLWRTRYHLFLVGPVEPVEPVEPELSVCRSGTEPVCRSGTEPGIGPGAQRVAAPTIAPIEEQLAPNPTHVEAPIHVTTRRVGVVRAASWALVVGASVGAVNNAFADQATMGSGLAAVIAGSVSFLWLRLLVR